MNEFDFIHNLTKIHQFHNDDVLTGIGDDCAVFRCGGEIMLVTTDMLIEDLHFNTNDKPESIGRKLLTVSLSDIAAMGGIPLFAVVSAGFSKDRFKKKSVEISKALFATAEEFNTCIIGGDTTGFKPDTEGIALSLTLIGKMAKSINPVLRKNAQVDDVIAVTGKLGGSLESKRHLTFEPRISEGQFLAEKGVNSMIDLSDGLIGDLGHILEQSCVGALINEDQIPVSETAKIKSVKTGKPAHIFALNDGEDFELLFTSTPENFEKIRKTWKFDLKLTKVGEVKDINFGLKINRTNGLTEPLNNQSWDHFQQ